MDPRTVTTYDLLRSIGHAIEVQNQLIASLIVLVAQPIKVISAEGESRDLVQRVIDVSANPPSFDGILAENIAKRNPPAGSVSGA